MLKANRLLEKTDLENPQFCPKARLYPLPLRQNREVGNVYFSLKTFAFLEK